MFERYLGGVRICLGANWELFGTSLGGILDAFGTNLRDVWEVFGRCLGWV